MKRKIMAAVAMITLMLAITPTSPAFERHPEIHDAIEALRSARAHLDHASHDFHGHRVEALKAIDEAIHQLQVCMQFD